MELSCPRCGHLISVQQQEVGGAVACPACGRQFRLQAAAEQRLVEAEAGRSPPPVAVAAAAPGRAEMNEDDLAAVRRLHSAYQTICDELSKAIIGQHAVIEQVLLAIFCRSHALLVGVPGLAKTLLVSSLSRVLELSFKRIQFTPDLMPADITGTEVLQEDRLAGTRQFKFLPGPIFANLILADEINRTPPKTQAALLESMQERQVTSGGVRHVLPDPFFVLATQNPIEQEGTYPLPEAQLDRFMFMILVDYPSRPEEIEIMRVTTAAVTPVLRATLGGEEILRLQEIVRRVPVADHVYEYVAELVRATRPKEARALPWIKEWVQWGSGPRACQYLILGAKARAILHGRFHATTEDVAAVAPPVLRHRVIVNFNAEAEGLSSEEIVARLLKEVPRAPEPVKTK